MNSTGLFIAPLYDRKHIVPYFLGLVACSACIIASLCGSSSLGFMNEASLRQRLGDGTDPAVMSPQKQGEEREHDETSHSFFCCSLALPGLLHCAHPCSASPVMGSCYRLVIHTPSALSPTPTPTLPGSSLVIFPGPALPCLFQPHRLWLHSQESQFHAHALAHRRRKLLI